MLALLTWLAVVGLIAYMLLTATKALLPTQANVAVSGDDNNGQERVNYELATVTTAFLFLAWQQYNADLTARLARSARLESWRIECELIHFFVAVVRFALEAEIENAATRETMLEYFDAFSERLSQLDNDTETNTPYDRELHEVLTHGLRVFGKRHPEPFRQIQLNRKAVVAGNGPVTLIDTYEDARRRVTLGQDVRDLEIALAIPVGHFENRLGGALDVIAHAHLVLAATTVLGAVKQAVPQYRILAR